VHNWSGRPTAPAVDALQSWAIKYGLPRRILMATGTNEHLQPAGLRRPVDRTMKIAGSGRTVVWVNVQIAGSPSRQRSSSRQRNGAWINSQLSDAQKKYPNLRIVRWAESLAAKPSNLTTYVPAGGVHTLSRPVRRRETTHLQALIAP
jgi:hypothetical protein